MISFGPEVRAFVATQPIDFRKGVHGLVALVAEGLKGDPYCGDVFVFRSKRADRLKILVFDGTGLVLATKWLEEGRFVWPPIQSGILQLTATQLAMLLDGLGEWFKIAPRSTTIVAEQLALDLVDAPAAPPAANDDAPQKPAAGKTRGKAKRNIGALPEYLPRCEQTIEPATTLCPCCAVQMHRIGEDVNEVLDRVLAVLRVLRIVRPKYACRGCEGAIVQAKAPARLIEGGMVSMALVSHIAVAKYGWFSTLYRQAQILAGYGILIDRQTLARWMKQAAWMLKSLYDLPQRDARA